MKRWKPFPNLSLLLRGHFFSGLLIVIPFAAIAWILHTAFTSFTDLILPEAWRPENELLKYAIAFAGLIVSTLLISVIGWISKQVIGQKLFEWLGEVIEHIPVLRTIYSALDQLMRTFGTGGGSQQFRRVVYLEYPRAGVWTLAFVTGPAQPPKGETEKFLGVYVPTTPNPTSGFYLIVPEKELRDCPLRVEEALKSILSLGLAPSGVNQ